MAIVSTVIAIPSFAVLRLLGRWAQAAPLILPVVNHDSLTRSEVGTRSRSIRFMAFFVRVYRRSYVHPYVHRGQGACRFIPSCTEYAMLAVERHGLLRGIWLTGGRISRCSPTYHGDYLDFP
jgi:uncharacterized protein